jgi:hypothetical protein
MRGQKVKGENKKNCKNFDGFFGRRLTQVARTDTDSLGHGLTRKKFAIGGHGERREDFNVERNCVLGIVNH